MAEEERLMPVPHCPHCDHFPPQSHPTGVSAESYVRVQSRIWPDTYKGITDASARVENETPVLSLTIDQETYTTHNFFQHRRAYANKPHLELRDVDDGLVEIWFHETARTITAWKCSNCGLIWDSTLGTLHDPD